jgi:hypothetical protein
MKITLDQQRAVESAVATAMRQYWAEFDDVTQHLYWWIASHQETVERLEYGHLCRRLRTAAQRYCRREKAQRSGYEPVDEYFYSLAKLAKVVLDAFDPEAVPPSETYRADELYAEWVTEVADVRAALRKKAFPLWAYTVLRKYVTEGRGEAEDPDVKRALMALQRQLGGSRPT